MMEKTDPGAPLDTAPLHTAEEIQAWLISRIAASQGLSPQSIDPREPFSRYGLDSLSATSLLADLARTLDRQLPATLLWEQPTIEVLSRHLSGAASDLTAVNHERARQSLSGEPIAVIGLSCRFPKAPNPEAFWRLLRDGVDAITEVPHDRWDTSALYDADVRAPGKMTTRWGGFLEQVDLFDPQFFGVSPREAVEVDPQQRLMLELSWEALHDAGAPTDGLKGSRTGVFFGAMWSDYAKVSGGSLGRIVQHTATGQDLSIISARVSYTLGLQGPSVVVNTACSSSLVAVHLACQSLRSGESTLALAGGVNLILAPESTIAMTKFGAMAPDGRSKAFDARANGYVRGEGGGVVVLKPLSLALADGDPIYCVIRGSAVNNDGLSNGLSAPNPEAQRAVLREAYANAGIDPKEVQYVEAHGTGTFLGDPIEAGALGAVLGAGRPAERPLRLGSVKTNIGHLEAAAGVSGLIKAALAIKHRLLPPSLHFQTPNPHIDFESLRLSVQQTLGAFPDEASPPLVGVSSFGFGGTNCHVVLSATHPGSVHLLPLSAGSADSLVALAEDMRTLSTAKEPRLPLPELCSMAAARLSHHDHRLALTVRSYVDLSAHLESFLQGGARPGMAAGRAEDAPSKLVFVFGGHGSQWLGMGQDLLHEEPVFRAALAQCDEAMRPYVSFSLLAELTASSPRSAERAGFVQPAIFAVQVALSALWRAWGIEPDAVVGQSIGEVAAAHVAGALSLSDAAQVICRMGEAAEQASGRGGGTAVLELSLPDAERALAGVEDRLWVAGCNSPSSTVISGDAAALDELLAKLDRQGVMGRRIKMDYASHSPLMDAQRPRLLRALEGISPRRSATPFYSTVTGAALDAAELGGAYWGRNLREPMRFASATERLLDDGYNVFLEVGPHPVLTHAVKQSLSRRGREATVLPSLRRREAGRAVLFDSLGALYARGLPVDWRRIDSFSKEASLSPPLPELRRLAEEVTAEVAPSDAVPPALLVLSARSGDALEASATAMSVWLRERRDSSLTDLCFTASARRSHQEHRLAVVGSSRQELSAALQAFGRGEPQVGLSQGQVKPGPRKVVFVFPGQGTQWAGMGRALLAEEAAFRRVVEACDALFRQHAGLSLLEELRAPESASRLLETEVAQPALFAFEVALAELWASWGVRPDAVIGHSVGEVAAAYVAGALGLEDAVRIVSHRGRLMQQATGLGKMAAVEMPASEAARWLSGALGQVTIAAVNAPGSVVLSGEAAALSDVLARLSREKVRFHEMRGNYAFHSPQMAPFQSALVSALGDVEPRRATAAMFSSVTGAKVLDGALDAAYWGRNVREPVQFADAVDAAIQEGHRIFVEVGPHPALTGYVQRCLEAQKTEGQALFSLRRGQEERRCLLQAVGALYTQGLPIDFARLYPASGRCVPLPSYPWQRQRYWLDAATPSADRRARVASEHPLLGIQLSVAGAGAVFETTLGVEAAPYLADHRVFGERIVPGVAVLELMRAAFAAQHGPGWHRVTGLLLETPLTLPETGARRVQVVLAEATAEGTQVSVYSQAMAAAPGEPFTLHATGHLAPAVLSMAPQAASAPPGLAPPPLDLGAAQARCRERIERAPLYAGFAAIGLEYGPAFQGITEIWRGSGEAVSRVALPAELGATGFGAHPVLLDAALQTLFVALGAQVAEQLYLPFEVEAFTLFQPAVTVAFAHARAAISSGPNAEVVGGDISIADDEGNVVAEVVGLRLKRASRAALRRPATRAPSEWLYRLAWQEAPAAGASGAEPSGRWLVLTDGSALGAALVGRLRAAGAWCGTVTRDEGVEGAGPDAFVVAASEPKAFEHVLAAANREAEPLRGVVSLWEAEASSPNTEAGPAEAVERSLSAHLHLVQALSERALSPRLFWVTRGAQAVRAGEPVDVASAPLWGLGRVVTLEHPALGCSLVDLERGTEDGAEELWRELCAAGDEGQVALRAGKRHVARLVKAPAARDEETPFAIAPESTVLITGGLGALGLIVATWLWEEHRVQHLVLLGRSAPDGERLRAVEALRAGGARVTVAQADVADASALRGLIASLPEEPPLAGVIHAAGLLDDGVLTQQSAARFARVLSPKVRGAWNLHEVTRDRPLAFFVLFSSVASLLGTAGQSNYAAANAFLDALAAERRALGLAAQSLNFGPWSGGGMAERMDATQRARAFSHGMDALSPAEGVALLGQALARKEAQLGLLPLDLRALQQALGAGEPPPIWRALVKAQPARAQASGAWRTRLEALAPTERAAEIKAALRGDVAKVLMLASTEEVPPERPLRELGLDSLMAVQLRNALSARVGKPLPATLVFDYPTVEALARYLLDDLPAAPRSRSAAPLLPAKGTQDEPIAIVGIGCRYPGGVRDLDSFWRLLERSEDAIREIPRERWDVDAYYDPDPDALGKMTTRSGGFLEGVDEFDPSFFGISPREAVKIDPQHRLLLEVSWEALEHAGQTAERLMGSETGVFVGLMYHEYETLNGRALEQIDGHTSTGAAGSVASGRISYLLGLKGPSLTLDTACSSSLVAVHLACQSLRSGECSMALAGGVTLVLTPTVHVDFSRLRGLAADGRCKSFDASADGVGWSEGCGVVVLKRLSDAERDGDPILALIRGSAVNQDGRSNGLTAPNGPSQEAVIRRALAQAGVSPSAVDYVEAHGTGTPLGDPIEVQALSAALRQGRAEDRPVVIGSVKTNIGHTQAAAGVAGIIKAALAMDRGVIPRTLHFTAPNPHIPWAELAVRVAEEALPWPPNGAPRIAGVSSFGFSGTNAHVVLEEAPRSAAVAAPKGEGAFVLLPLSAKSPEALSALARAYQSFLAEARVSLADIAYTASVRRVHHEHRVAVVGRTEQELALSLEAFGRGEGHAGITQGRASGGAQPKVVFVYSGQGSQWAGMGRALLAEEPVFRRAMEECDALVKQHAGFSLLDVLSAPEATSRLGETEVAQPSLFAIEVALSALWASWGVRPDAVIGHSVGEVAAAHVAGALSLEEAVRLVVCRGRVMQRATGLGKMASAALPAEAARRALQGYDDRLSIAAVNDPGSVVLSGEATALEEVFKRLEQAQVRCRWLPVNYAFHSPQMEPLADELARALGALQARRTELPMYSTVSGEAASGEELDPAYWARNVREPVDLAGAVKAALSDGHRLFVEVGPHAVLSGHLTQCLEAQGTAGQVVYSLRREREERRTLLLSLGALYSAGYPVEWKQLYPSGGRCVPLPAYPWQRQRYWIEAAPDQAETAAPSTWLYRLVWQAAPLDPKAEPQGTWLVLTDGSALGQALIKRLKAAGARCITVGLREGEKEEGFDLRVEEPREPLAFAPALSLADAEGSPLEGVVCLWGAERARGAESAPPDRAEALTALALHLVQALARREAHEAPRLFWVTEGAQLVHPGEAVDVAQAPLWGLGRVVMQEHPELGCTLVDLEPGREGAAEALWRELCAADGETQVAWRAGQRHVARLSKAPSARGQATPPIAAESTVLITGGLGALGLQVARWLWEEHRVQHLMLVGRSAPEGERLQAVEALRERGARVTVAQADVADRAAVRALLRAVPAELPLGGVIHAAGVLDDGVLAQQSAARFARVFSPKARGAWNLHEETRALRLGFFVMFSSATSVLGSAGQSNYAAANAFLDGLAEERHAEGLAAQSLNWGPWADRGMAETLNAAERMRLRRYGLGTLSPAEGVALLGQALCRAEAGLCVLPLDLRALQQAFAASEVPPLWRALLERSPTHPRQAARGGWARELAALTPEARLAEVEAVVRAEAATVLGFGAPGDVPVDRSMQELGLSSLMTLEIRNALAARLGKALPATLVFNYPTVAALARHLLEQMQLTPAASPAPPIAAPTAQQEPIAIVGIGCRYPGGVRDLESFWRLLSQEVDAIGEVPKERWDLDAYYDPDPEARGKMVTRWGGFLSEVDQFDPAFFEISPREAVGLDPQQRLLLEVSWEALEQAGQTPERLWGSDTGVYMGVSSSEYQAMAEALEPYVLLGTMHSTSTARLSYWLGLKGPNMPVDTACSSSLVAVHLACQALRAGDCSLALAGGVNLILSPEATVCLSSMRAMSPTGRCHTFSADADGYVRSEGCGVLVLKRLSDAERDGDPILAVIRGSAVNQDGRSNGLTAPNGPSQEAVIRRALAQAGVSPKAVGYVEAHGTGTPLGDPIEVQALSAVLSEGRAKEQPVVVGSVKTNIGHTEAAAGVAGLIKAVLSLKREVIPRSLHFTAPNPHIPWEELPVKVATEALPWRANGAPRIAGVSSFGISGTNAHVVLEEAPRSATAAPRAEASALILPLSAKSLSSLSALAAEYRAFLTEEAAPPLPDVAYTASVRRSHHAHRLALVGSSREELCAALEAFGRGELGGGALQGEVTPGSRPKVVFVYSGQGSQWVGMGRALLEEEPVFRRAVEACEPLIQRHAGFSLLAALSAPEERSRLSETEVVQPALFALQVALSALWGSWGVHPDAVVGHSVGEVAAAHLAGALSLEQAVRLVCCRGRVMQRATGLGKMAAVALSAEAATSSLQGYEGRLSIAAVNDPAAVVLAGEPAALSELVERLEGQGAECRMLRVNYAFHSPQMAPFERELVDALGWLEVRRAARPMYSTVSGAPIGGEALDAAYWGKNLRAPVAFARAIEAAARDGHQVFVEIGPHPVLSGHIEQCLRADKQRGQVVYSLRRGRAERRTMLLSLGALYAAGAPVEWKGLYSPAGRCVPLPAYRFQRQRYWLETARAENGAARRLRHATASGRAGGSVAEPTAERDARGTNGSEAPEDPQRWQDPYEPWLYSLTWRRRDHDAGPAESALPSAGGFLLWTDRSGTGAGLRALLQERGERCVQVVAGERYARLEEGLYQVNPSDPEGYRAVLSDAFGDGRSCRGIVHLFSLDATAAADASAETLLSDQRLSSLSALYLAQALLRAGWRKLPRLLLVTRGAQAVGTEAAPLEVSQAPLWGLGRTLSLEHPKLECARVDLGPRRGAEEPRALLQELASSDGEDQIALREEGRYVARLARSSFEAEPRGLPDFQAEGSYWITGGLSGLGLSVAKWLVARGARHLALMGRSGASAAARAAISAMEEAGAAVLVLQADVSQRAEVERALRAIEQRLPPLRGIVHAAAVLDDRTALELSQEPFDKVMAPKVEGAWNLHAATLDKRLSFFVLYSAAASLLGSPGQGNYSAANAFLDALARYRRSLGLVGLSINWGPFSEVGLAAAQQNRGERLSDRGIRSLSPADGLAILGRLVAEDRAQIGVMNLNVRQWLQSYPSAAHSPLFSELLREGSVAKPASEGASRLREVLLKTSPEERPAVLEEHLCEELGQVLRLDVPRIDRLAAFTSLGVDSLMSLELRNRLESSLGIELSATMLFTYANLARLTEHLLERMKLSVELKISSPREEGEDTLADLPEEMDALDKDELLSLFDETVGRIATESQA